jgi:uncharacterized protein HemX
MARRRTLWLPALLSTLALLVVISGVIVGQFYWANVHSNLWRVETSMSQARENQRLLLEQIARSRALLAEQQRGLQAESEALAAAREKLAEERAALEKERTTRTRQAQDAKRLRETAALVDQARGALAQSRGTTADEMLAAAQARLEAVGAPPGHALQLKVRSVRDRLRTQSPVTRDTLTARITKVRAQALALAQQRPPPGWYDPGLAPRGGAPATGSLIAHLDRARIALDRGDADLYGRSLETARSWLNTFFDPRRTEIAQLAQAIADLEQAPGQPDYEAVITDLAGLGNELRQAAGALQADARGAGGAVCPAPSPPPSPRAAPTD